MTNGRQIGVNFDNHGIASIRVWAPDADEVSLQIQGRKKHLPLQKEAFGYWTLLSGQLKPGDTYCFVLNGSRELPDVASLSQPDGVHGWSEAVDLKDFKWTDAGWKNQPLADYLIYELHTGTFTPEGTFAGIMQQLDHLVALGINAIEIMPVAQFPGGRNWGYDGVFPFAVQNTYGGPGQLMQLVDACHSKGIAVILDVVYNHLGPEGNYFSQYGPYFTEKYNTPWGNAINFDDAWCDGVRDFYVDNALMWFRDFHIDALRLDAVHAIKDFGAKHILQQVKEETDKLIALTGIPHYLIVELDLNDHRFINSINDCGYGMDAQWIDEFHHALRVTAGGKKEGYYSDFNGIEHLAKAYTDAYVYDGAYSPHRKKKFGNKATHNPGEQFIVFSQNHDQVGNRMLGERSSMLFSFEMQKLMAGAVLVSPYLPMLFMGEEWGSQTPFQYFVSHGDEELIAAVRKGRQQEFAAFHAAGETPDPQSEETFNRSKLNRSEIHTEQRATMLAYYQALIALRKNLAALKTPDRKHLVVDFNREQQTMVLLRGKDAAQVCCLMNFSSVQQKINLPEGGQWQPVFDSADKVWGGPGALSFNGHKLVNAQPQSIIIYQL